MNEKYELMFLGYLYDLLSLKEYEETLKEKNINSILYDENNLFTYFSLLNRGTTDFFDEEEKKELYFLSNYDLKELLTVFELKTRCYSFLKRTYDKYFFSNITGNDYVYYGPVDYEYMVPDDAIALAVNYQKFDDNILDDDQLLIKDEIIYNIINEIQFKRAKEKNIKVAIIKKDELTLNNPSINII